MTYFTLQDLLPIILQNITDILLSKAKNMNAKDERFIIQGVYNLLYGTVELMMVSAEASAVTVNNQTLSVDQLEVGFLKAGVNMNFGEVLRG